MSRASGHGGTLTLVLDRDELGPDPAASPAAAGDLRLVLDADAWHALRRLGGGPLLTPDAVLRRPDAIAGWSDAMLATWRRHARLEHEGWDLLAFVAVRHVRWARRLASVAVPLLETIDRWHPARLRLLSPPGGHALDGAGDGDRGGALIGLAADLARERGLELVLADGPTAEPESAAAATAEPESAAADAGPHEPEAPPDAWAAGHLLLVGDGPDRARHGGLVARLRTRAGVEVLEVVRTRRAGATTVAAYAGPRARVRVAGAEAARDRLLAAAAALPAGHPGRTLAGPGLRAHVEHLFGPYADALAGNVARWRLALARRRPSVVVAAHPEIPLEVAARTGIPTVLLPHGAIMPDEVAYHRCLHPAITIGATGPRQHAALVAAGIDAARVRTTGVPGAATPGPASASPADAATRPFTILVPTAETWRPSRKGGAPEPTFAVEHRALGQLARAAASRGWRVLVRRHPRFDRGPAFYRESAPPGAIELDASPSLPAAVRAADVLVALGAPSSAILEAVHAGCPVVLLAGPGRTTNWRRLGLDRLPHAADVAGLLARLEELAATPEATATLVARARAVVAELLAPGAEAASADVVLAERRPIASAAAPTPAAPAADAA